MKTFGQFLQLLTVISVTGCFTASQPTAPTNACPACPAPTVTQKLVIKTVTIVDEDTVDIKTSDTLRVPTHDTLRQTFITPVYIDTTGVSQDVHIQLTPGSPDNSLELQQQIDAVDFNPGVTNVHVKVNHGNFTFTHGILFHNWQAARGVYFPFTIDFEGDAGAAATTDGTGTIFTFLVKDCFWIGFQGAKGCKFHGITLYGSWNNQITSDYQFYSGGGMTPLEFRDDNFSPCAAIAFDPFGPSVPAGGGYPGTDAYGKPWSGYYRGSNNGSTGCQVYDIKFIGTWISIITSPNGQTANAEAMHFYNLNFDINNANPIVGCQDQEKLNEVGPGIIDWGATKTFIQIGTYGAHRPGNWIVHGVNIAGMVYRFIYDNTGGYYPVHIYDIFGETLGGFGYLGGQMHNSVERCHIDFANPVDAAFQYLNPQIDGCNTTYRNCNFRFYGMPTWPINVLNHDGWNVFDGCGFDNVPVYQLYPANGTGRPAPFIKCGVGGIVYDSISAVPVPIYGGSEQFQPYYTIKDSLVGKYYQATIPIASTELTLGNIYVNEVLVAKTPLDVLVGVAGVITGIDTIHKTFNLCYIPQSIISGQKYALYSWKQNLKL